MTSISTLWEPFGLSGNPFFQSELSPGDPVHPVSLFVGRDSELQRVRRRLSTDTSTRTIIEGAPGVGKTSFVNRLKSDLAKHGIATYDRPIRIDSKSTRSSFVADVLRTLVRIRLGMGLSNGTGIWARTVRLLEGQDLTGGSVSVMGVGGGFTRSYAAPQAPPDSLYEHLGAALEELSRELSGPVVLHVNNLEALTLERTEAAATLLVDLRDYLLLPGAHWMFVGATGIEQAIFRAHAQVSGIFPQAFVLEPLPPPEIERLLELRYKHLKIRGQQVTPPIEPAEAARLYALYQGDLRNFLRLLTEAAEALLGVQGVRPMSELDVRRFGAGEYEQKLRERLGDDDFVHLRRILDDHADAEVRVTEAARSTKLTQGATSKLIQRLEQKRAIRLTRTAGKSRYYRPFGDVLVAFGVVPHALLAPGGSPPR
ncbi:MAG TPA: AAA family ATPase [Longimicrobium sp.]|nr:AAA family ATPase [Longimicrobium sp.]